MVRNKLHWDANDAVGLQKQRNSYQSNRLSFVLKVSLRHLRPSVIYSVPCDRILQRAYLAFSLAFAAFAVNVDLEISNDPAKIQIRELS